MAKIFVSFTIVSTSDFFLVAREDANPLAEVYRSSVLTPPHAQRNITISNLNPVMHRIELWTTVDGINLNQLRGRCDIDASQYTQVAFDNLYFVVGRGLPLDPAAGTNQYDNPDLAGKQNTVFQPGFGPLIENIHIARNTVGGVDQGGFHYINGQTFPDEAEYTIMIANLSTQQVTTGGNGSFPDGLKQVAADTLFDSTFYNKLIEINPPNNDPVWITFNDFNVIPDNTKFTINTSLFNPNLGYRYTVLQLPSGCVCNINGKPRNTIYIGRDETVSFMKVGVTLYTLNEWVAPRMVGTRVYKESVWPINGLPFIGMWVWISEYLRLFHWYVNELPWWELATGYTDDQNPDMFARLKWIIGVNKFWIPDLSNYIKRNTRPGRLSGAYEDQSVQALNVITTAWTGTGLGRNSLVANAGVGFLATHGDGGSVSSNGSSGVNRPAARTDYWPVDVSGSTETKPRNVAVDEYVLY